jgi:hypothetical protein
VHSLSKEKALLPLLANMRLTSVGPGTAEYLKAANIIISRHSLINRQQQLQQAATAARTHHLSNSANCIASVLMTGVVVGLSKQGKRTVRQSPAAHIKHSREHGHRQRSVACETQNEMRQDI